MTRENASAGQMYIDEVHMYRTNDPAHVDVLRQPYANSIEHFDAMNAAQWDLYIQSAEEHGVYLKLVIDEKNEWIRNHMGADGKMTLTGSNDNFYAAPGTKVRWLEQAWWRYIIARWGYSPAVHSFEYINEGDPYNGRLYEATEAMAKYFHQNDPSHHMVTTSFWSSFPNMEFWSNPLYADMDYVDLHAYISTGWGLTAVISPVKYVRDPAGIRAFGRRLGGDQRGEPGEYFHCAARGSDPGAGGVGHQVLDEGRRVDRQLPIRWQRQHAAGEVAVGWGHV